ncbi:aspartic peptidase domain-containing protein [Suillus clintonianus]|uniref:aspartic peptidase domain-containing protein n=1 Tax=Suillus clintonianus TaxID=1904413 RepID=UPI001B884987|nr:aspartic peptidase domain-containing protein [Suillus clintonianus]KAG2123082.1 aspartic peptidase domain-containing protein [Suillus clintonianus]
MTLPKGAHVSSRAEGKQRARDEGTGGAGGMVLNLEMVATSYNSFAYVVPVLVGSAQQNLSLQVDTGSSDLWIASKSCSTASCSSTDGRLYDPTSSTPTGASFTIDYLSGTVSGPIVWDTVQLGTYSLQNQALAAATSISNEPLSLDFDGILGLALPLNSVIEQAVPPATDNNPDGASFSSNLFSMTPASTAPSQPFFSLTFARPGSDEIPSLLGIGMHPSSVVPDPSKINYSTLVSQGVGTLFWKTNLRAITVYVNGQARPVLLTDSVTGAAFPTALLDSGVPLIITTSSIANGIYGALGISPASDGNYYVPCTTPLNMTITLDGQPELPIHPLDLTNEPSGQHNAQYCIGLIQADDSQLTATSQIGDMVLGVPFMRNVYTVLAYEPSPFNVSVYTGIRPTLGLMGLTNITQALDEFNNVRVLNQPLGGSPPQQTSSSNDTKLSVGLEVLIGLIGFFALCFTLFGLKWFMTRRQWKKQGMVDTDGGKKGEGEYMAYQLTRRNSRSSDDAPPVSTLRTLAYNSYATRKEKVSEYTFDSNGTRVEPDPVEEFGQWKAKYDHSPPSIFELSDPWDPHAGNRDTIVGTEAPLPDTPSSPDLSATIHRRTPDEISRLPESISVPLLTDRHRRRSSSQSSDSDVAEVGVGMAGVGTLARGSQIIGDMRHHPSRGDNADRNSTSLGSRNDIITPSWRYRASHEHPDTFDVVDIH